MKNCQEKKHKNKLLYFGLFFIIFFLINIKISNAAGVFFDAITNATVGGVSCQTDSLADVSKAEEAIKSQLGTGNQIQTIDISTIEGVKKINCTDQRGFMERRMDQVKSWVIDEALVQLKKSGDVAYKQGLRFFLNTLAYDTATYLATGDKGQKPMFETEGWGPYLKNVADNAAGTFIEELGKNMSTLKFNLCKPDPSVLLKINLGLSRTVKPKAPECSFSKMVNNWDAALKDKDFLPKFQDMFNPWSNDLGIALTLQTGIESQISQKVNEAAQDRIEGKGWLSVKDPITGNIKTPAALVDAAAKQPILESTASEKVYTGSIIADSIDIFINTLAGRLIEKWLKKGLVTNFPEKMSSLTDPNAQNENEGIAGAENRMRSLIEPNFKVRGDYDILAELTMCPDPNKAGPTNCVIDERFREAIEKRLTVGQAMEQGYLNGNGVFGFTSDGLEPKFNEGYPYRSMLILRKFRILSMGWEVAAQKIKDNQATVGGTKNLKDLAECFSGIDEYGAKGNMPTWCLGLVDPDWVLKAPQNFCKKEGAGPEILSEQVTGEGVASSLNILRNDSYCADEQSCVKEKADGSCQLYGYCTEERRKWDFNGKSCEPRDNTCQTFQLEDQTVSYLQNTLDFSICNAANAGCKKYATTGSYNAASKTVAWDGNANPVYLNKNAEACDAADQGCHGFIRITPDKNETYDDIKNAGIDAAYNRFKPTGLIYQKLLPDYLKTSCYSYDASGNILDGRLLAGAPAECSNFVRECKQAEAGCELYTSATDGFKIPAKVDPQDYCPAECVGYDTFVQKETNFDPSRDAYFIPKTAKTCSAETAGCEQFTNLDEVKKGGEGIEYYTYLRQCLKKSDNAVSCGEFYTWEGSDESGYQLKVESLKTSGAEPAVTASDATLCTEAIYNLLPSNPAYNPDCRQFYNREGGVSYYLYSRTVTCSDDCHPYRKTVAIDDTAASCRGGGVWDDSEKACIYMAIPGQGMTCSAAQNGCREYSGNTGNNVRNIFTDDFSGGTTGGWVGVNGSAVAASSEALALDSDNKGNSILVKDSPFSAKRAVGSAVTEGKSYVLNFVVKAAGATDLNLSLVNSSGAKASFTKVALGAGWQIFQTSLADLNHKVAVDEFLLLEAGQNFYIDSITLIEIIDRYYLIKNSWRTPASCDEEEPGVPHELFMLGCDQYADRANKTHYLKKFSELCSESAVGCELMIDTKNLTAIAEETFTNSGTTKTVPADSFIYAVYDREKQCSAGAKGCEFLGKSYKYGDAILYGDTYLKNDPDKYNQILCGIDAVGCQTFAYDKGEKYFKDPGDQVCEWRREAGAGESQGWFKKKVKRCGSDAGMVCLSDKDCSGGLKCQLEILDKPCPTDENKTLGLGGVGGRVSQPGEDTSGKWAGICAATNSGCGEYIDPVSKFNTNIVFNGSFEILATSKTDGWKSGAQCPLGGYCQDITLEPNTVYRLARLKKDNILPGTLSINCPSANALYEIKNDNSNTYQILEGPKSSLGPLSGGANSVIFYYQSSAAASCTVTAGAATGVVELKPVVIDYQLRQNLDSSSCNGVVDFDKGCVLFNERIRDGAVLKALDSDADTDLFGSAANPADKDSNIILKVMPDRTCDKWLACRSYIKDEKGNNTCYDVGLCDAVDDKGDCNSFIISPKKNQAVEDLGADKISNLSGYAKVGITGGSLINDYYPFGAMEQKGEVVNLANGGFEFYGSNGYPMGWTWSGQEAANKLWDTNVFSVVNNPISAQAEGIGYAREGRSFIKLGSSYDATSEEVDVIPNTDYIITAYANTKNLKSGVATIDIIGNTINKQNITQNISNDWQFKVGSFKTGAGVSRIKVKLAAPGAGGTAGSEGNFYFDDIKIRPALNSKDNWHTTQSCRLYPKADSLACDYYEDSGNRQKGWPGYCLEYDRAPGDSNSCILWYPIDKVKGDGIEEGVGYLGKAPVYYSLVNKTERFAEYRHAYFYGRGRWDSCSNVNCPVNYACVDYDVSEVSNSWDDVSINCVPDGKGIVISDGSKDSTPQTRPPTSSKDGWYPYDGVESWINPGNPVLINSTNNAFAEYLCNGLNACNLTQELFRTKLFSIELVQTVTLVGQNKYWSSRVYKGSDYTVPGLGFIYGSDSAPFGSMVPPSPVNNPYEWDGDTNINFNQPIYYNIPSSGQARIGQAYSCIPTNPNDCKYVVDLSAQDFYPYISVDLSSAIGKTNNEELIKRLFAQSYGIWQWDGVNKKYIKTTGQDWGPPASICGGARPNYPNDYCAILPVVDNDANPGNGNNIKVNGKTGNVELTKNGFVNLTFNTKVDSNQLPLVMYAVDWGDDESTTVTGVEMRDRPNSDNPHSLYHLYGYWDLKAKDNQSKLNGDCGSNCKNDGYCLDYTGAYCRIKPKVMIKDNWGWCNGGISINDCDQWQSFAAEVVVKEK